MARSKVAGAQFGFVIPANVVKLTVPDAANAAEVFVHSGTFAYTRDGTNPSRNRGQPGYPGNRVYLNSEAECKAFEACRSTDEDALVDVEYFTEPPYMIQMEPGQALQFDAGGVVQQTVSSVSPLPVDIAGLTSIMTRVWDELRANTQAVRQITSRR